MKTLTVYQWEDSDDSLNYVRHALNRLIAFKKPEDEPIAENRLLKGNQFFANDVQLVCDYLNVLAARATMKWSATERQGDYADAILQSAEAANDAACQLKNQFSEACAGLRETPRYEKARTGVGDMNNRSIVKAIAEQDKIVKCNGRSFCESVGGGICSKCGNDIEHDCHKPYKPYLTSRDAIVPLIVKQSWETKIDIGVALFKVIGFATDAENETKLPNTWGDVINDYTCATPRDLCEALLRSKGKWTA